MSLRIRSALGLALGLSLVACAPPGKPAEEKKAEASKTEAKDEVVETPAEAEGESEAAAADVPAWFNPDVLAHKSVLQNGRSEVRADGSVSSAMLLELEDGETIAGCMEKLRAKVSVDIADLAEPTEGKAGRLDLRAETETYTLALICGLGKEEKLTAYLSLSTKPG
jgi:hypothetical protein